MAKRDVIHKSGSTYHIATPPEEDRATASGDLRNKFREDRSSGSKDMLADRHTHRQTNTQTDTLIRILRSQRCAAADASASFVSVRGRTRTQPYVQLRTRTRTRFTEFVNLSCLVLSCTR